MDKKPNVTPSKEQMSAAAAEKAKIDAYETEKAIVTNDIYATATNEANVPDGQISAVEMMRRRTANQLQQIQNGDVVKENDFAEETSASSYGIMARLKNEEQMRLRDEQLKKNLENTQNFQRQTEEATTRHNNIPTPTEMPQNVQANNYQNNYTPPTPPSTPITNYSDSYGQNPSNINPAIYELSQPNYNAPFDVIPLPSKGKLYKNKKASIRVGYMTTADENILTSPNLLQSGEFLEILINRKILEPELRYKDLLVGDRNAIMIWLRATSYGEMYPVTLLDELDEPFDSVVNLNELKTIELGVEPDADGLFSFTLPLSKVQLRFRPLTCGDISDLEKRIAKDKENNMLVDNTSTYRLERMIVEVNGDRDKNIIRDVANGMRIGDAKAFNEYIETVDCGIDLNINVETPGGGSVATFLPLNLNFFWPNFRV